MTCHGKSHQKKDQGLIDLATSIKNEKHDVSVSNIMIRVDDKKLEEKRHDYWPFRENQKKPFEQKKVTFK